MNYEYIGDSGTGSFTQTGGTNVSQVTKEILCTSDTMPAAAERIPSAAAACSPR